MHTQTQFPNLRAFTEPEPYNAAARARQQLEEDGALTPFLADLLATIERALDDLHAEIAPRAREILDLEQQLQTI